MRIRLMNFGGDLELGVQSAHTNILNQFWKRQGIMSWWVFWADSHAVSVGVFSEVQQQDMDLFPVHFEKAEK